jgi:hypothetical protein
MRKMIKYSTSHEICELNLNRNSNQNQKREIKVNLLKLDFLNFSPNFDKNFEIENSHG